MRDQYKRLMLYVNGGRTFNVAIAREVGINASIFLCDLISALGSIDEKLLKRDGKGNIWIYRTLSQVEENTTLSRSQQDTALKILVDSDLVKTKVFGLPPKRHFFVDIDKIQELIFFSSSKTGSDVNLSQFVENQQIDMQKIDKTICRKPATRDVENQQIDLRVHSKSYLYNREKITEIKKKGKNREALLPQKSSVEAKDELHEGAPPSPLSRGKSNSFSSGFSLEKAKKSEESRVEVRPNVFLTQEQYDNLVSQWGKDDFNAACDYLALWKESASPYKVKAHTDYYRLRAWAIDRIRSTKPKRKPGIRERFHEDHPRDLNSIDDHEEFKRYQQNLRNSENSHRNGDSSD